MPPMVAQVCADVQLCRLGARVQAQLITGLRVVQRKDLLLSDPVASAFPRVAAVLARPHTTATHSREDRAPGRLDDQRLDVLPAQLTAAFLPGRSDPGAVEHHDAVRGACEQLGGRLALLIKVSAI